MDLYLFKSENEIERYENQTFKYYIDKRLYKSVSNPTDDEKKTFGFKPLVEEEIPEYDEEKEYIVMSYVDGEEYITKHYEVKEIDPEQTQSEE